MCQERTWSDVDQFPCAFCYQPLCSFLQVAKQIRSADGSQSCNNVFSVMNGFGEIIAQQAALTTSMDEVEPLLAGLPARNARFGFPVSRSPDFLALVL
jgi:hypothetical protein